MKAIVAIFGVLFAFFTAFEQEAKADTHSSKPLKIIVGYSPGGALDGLARQIGAAITEKTGQAVVVENRTGGATVPAVQALLSAPADGQTMAIFEPTTVAINPFVFKKPPYDVSSLEPVALLAEYSLGLIVRADFPATNLREFIAYVNSHPGTAFATAGNATPHHIAMEMFRQRAGLASMVHIPYKGGAPAMLDIVAGQVPVAMLDIASSMQYIKAGKVRLLAVATEKRLDAFPNVPTIAESGFPGFAYVAWFAAFVPKGTPPSAISPLSGRLKEALASPRVSTWLTGMTLQSNFLNPESFKPVLRSETEKHQKIISSLGLAVD